MTQAQIQHIFQQRYNHNTWKQFLGQAFLNARLLSKPEELSGINKDVALGAFKLGYILLDEEGIERQIAIYEVVLAEGIVLERNRVGLRNLLRKYWKNIDAAFIAYYNPGNTNWRFTYVSELTGFDAEGELIHIKTEPKRYTYILGEGETCRTAADRFALLISKGKNVSLDDIKDAFSVEKLSKAFFDEYKSQYEDFVEFLIGRRIIKVDGAWKGVQTHQPSPQLSFIFHGDVKAARDFCKKMLGRIVFLYFLQKKGWLGVSITGNWGEGNKNFMPELFEKFRHKEIFYSELLTKLFFEALNTVREDSIIELISGEPCKIPYLNGGLFEEENPEYRKLIFPAQLFQKLFTFFNQYNFTIYEDDPNDHTIAVDPEMLGHIFENLLEDNKDKGAYYTPKEIVHYMCQESLIEYLTIWFESRGYQISGHIGFDKPNQLQLYPVNEGRKGQMFLGYSNKTKSNTISRTLIEKLLKKSLDNEDKLEVQKHYDEFQDALDNVKICDPAIGSGAFPMGLLHEIFNAKHTLFSFKHGSTDGFNAASVKLDIIQNSIYGVDIEKGAVDIARLRFWLSLIVDEPVPRALPNLDYKIMQGNSLLESFEDIDLCVKVTEETKLFRDDNKFSLDDIKQLKQLVKKYFNAESKEQKNGLQNKIEGIVSKFIYERINEKIKHNNEQLEDIQRKLVLTNLQHPKTSSEVSKKEEAILKNNAILKRLLKEAEILSKKKDELKLIQKTKNNPFFLWHLWFSDIFDAGGFDIVIGNPPYIGQKGNNEIFIPVKNSALGSFHQRRMDYFYFFFHQAINLARSKGVINFITTNYYITATYADKLRQDFKDRTSFRQFVNFNELKIFGSAMGQHNLISLIIKGTNAYNIKVIDTQKKGFADSSILNQILNYSDSDTSYFELPDQNIYEGRLNYIRLKNESSKSAGIDKILNAVREAGRPLSEICYLTTGVQSGAEKLTPAHIKKYHINGMTGEGIFILNQREIELLNLSEKELSYLKPYFKNSDIQKWVTNEQSTEKLIYYTSKTLTEIGSNLFSHFEKYKTILINRNTRSGTPTITNGIYDKFVKGHDTISYVMIASAFKRGAYYCVSYARDEKFFISPKIVAPQRSPLNTFGYNETTWFGGTDIHFIITKDKTVKLKYILALINSKLYYSWLYHKGKRKGETLELVLAPLSEIPIKEVDINLQMRFVEIVDKILASKSVGKDTTPLEQLIDNLVYKLYELTYDEVKVIEPDYRMTKQEYESIKL